MLLLLSLSKVGCVFALAVAGDFIFLTSSLFRRFWIRQKSRALWSRKSKVWSAPAIGSTGKFRLRRWPQVSDLHFFFKFHCDPGRFCVLPSFFYAFLYPGRKTLFIYLFFFCYQSYQLIYTFHVHILSVFIQYHYPFNRDGVTPWPLTRDPSFEELRSKSCSWQACVSKPEP